MRLRKRRSSIVKLRATRLQLRVRGLQSWIASVLDRLDREVTSISPDPVTGLTITPSDQRISGGFVTSTVYDNLSNVLSVTNGLNQVTSFTYDDLNRITKVSTPNATSGPTVDTQFAYSTYGYGWKIKQTDALGGVIDTQLDGLGRVRTVSGSATSTQNARYWTDGTLKSTYDQRGNVTDYDYNVRGRLKSVTEPAPTAGAARSVTSYQYSVDSLLSSMTDPMSRVTSFGYDAGGRNKRVTQPDPDPAGQQTSSYTDTIYDSLGNVLAQQDALGHKTTYSLDSRFQTVASTDALGATTSLSYDSFGNVLSVLDPLSNSTVYTYNNWNQVVTENKPVSTTSYFKRYSYDGLGNLRTETDRRGRIIDLAYDNRNRVTTETWKTTSTVCRTFNTSYDNQDRTTAIDDSDPFSTDFQFAYDAKSQLQSERQSPALVGTSVALDRNYDVDGNETQLIGYFGATLSGQSFTGGIKDFINNYAYDGMNRVTSVTQATPSQGSALGVNTVAAKSAYFTYNVASQLVDMRRYNAFSPVTANLQVHSRYAYDNAGRLTSLTHGRTLIAGGESWNGTSSVPASLTPSTLLAAYSYSYDTANKITSMSSYRDAFKAAYTYDDTNQLTTVTNTAISGLTPPFTVPTGESYLLDANGNRKSSSGASQSASGT